MSNCKDNKEESCKSYPLCYGCNAFQNPTYYDLIRSMSVAEMAEFIAKERMSVGKNTLELVGYSQEYIDNLQNGARAVIKEWLESEVSDNDSRPDKSNS